VDLRAHTVLLVLGGSRAYGLAGPDSDVDLKGAAIPPAAHFHGLRSTFEQADRAEDIAVFAGDLHPHEREAAARTKLEGTVYEIRKLLRLALDANPNVLDVLFCRDEEVRLIRDAGRELRAQRSLFLSQRCAETFTGYARAQLQRIKTHPVEPHGYNTKHGAHLVRLLRMGREILTTGEVHVWRGDRDAAELVAIRGGAWSYDRLLAEAEREQEAIRAVGPRAAVPPEPDLDAVDRLCVSIVERFLRAT
jgi:predicted nucleotidyltransferase